MVLVEYKWMLKNIYGEDKGPTKGGGASGNNHKNLESEKKKKEEGLAYTATTNTKRRINQSIKISLQLSFRHCSNPNTIWQTS